MKDETATWCWSSNNAQIEKEHLCLDIEAFEARLNLLLSDSFCISAISSFNRLVRSQWPCPVKSLAISRLIIHESICVSFIFLNKILKTKFGINWDITELANQGAFSRKCLRIQYAQLNNFRGHLNSFIFVKFILTALLTYKFGCSLSA